MKWMLGLILAVSLLLSGCRADTGIEVRAAWARPAAQGENGAVYFVIHNDGPDDELTGVSSDIAAAVEMHESQMEGEVMQMRQLEFIPLQTGAEIAFEPGGYHIMLIDLKEDLNVGDEIEIALDFRNFEDLNIQVPVRETPAP